MNGERHILGIWAGDGSEGSRFWLQVFSKLKNRGVVKEPGRRRRAHRRLQRLERPDRGDHHHLGADGGAAVHRAPDPQQIPLCRQATQRRIVKALKPIYTAPSEAAAKDRFKEFTAEWGERYPAIVKFWESSRAEFVPFLKYDVEIRRVICTTNVIESMNARYRWTLRARAHFPNEAAALKCLYLVARSFDPSGGSRARWVIRRKPALNAFAITFAGRFERITH